MGKGKRVAEKRRKEVEDLRGQTLAEIREKRKRADSLLAKKEYT